MCFNLNSIAVPESSSLYPSFTESSQYSQFKNGRLSVMQETQLFCMFSCEAAPLVVINIAIANLTKYSLAGNRGGRWTEEFPCQWCKKV